MSRNLLLSGAIVLALVAVVATLAIAIESPAEGESEAVATVDPAGTPVPVVTDTMHRLSTAEDGKVTFTEFLDFECESCGAIYPAIEQLRERYAGRVTFAFRYFPNDGHFNAMNAAAAVEAASKQGKTEAMYQRLFETQAEWGRRRSPSASSSSASRKTSASTWISSCATSTTRRRSSASCPTATPGSPWA